MARRFVSAEVDIRMRLVGEKHGDGELPADDFGIRVPLSPQAGFFRNLFAFSGPGLMVAVGYMDPGNWATDLAGGARFGYTLLSVILLSNLTAILLQHLSLKLGIVTGKDLAQACRDNYSKPVSFLLWILCEIAIAACDVAEIIGSAIAIHLLFGTPLPVAVAITALDVFIILFLQHRGYRWLEAIIAVMIVTIGGCFTYELIVARPDWAAVARGILPSVQILKNPEMLYIAIGILGATVMPHNLYLHSRVVQTRGYTRDEPGKRMAIRFATIDSTLALMLAFLVNGAILVLSAAAFYGTEYAKVADIQDAHRLLSSTLGAPMASLVFAIALLASGQNATITGTMAGQIVMEGFLHIRLRPWIRRLLTRAVALVPAIVVAVVYGERGAGDLLILSQVILSAQLAFAVIPLVQFTGSRKMMGVFMNSRALSALAWFSAAAIVALNSYLLWAVLVR